MDPTPRKSYFPCWQCIKASARAETQEKHARAVAAAAAAEAAREQAFRLKLENEKRVREERVRREAREKAERERAAEQKMRAEKEAERERAKREGGVWTLAESGSGKKKKGKGPGLAGSVGGTSAAFPTTSVVKKDAWKENGKGSWKESQKGNESSGRAGTWGPKKILSRKEGNAGFMVARADSAAESNERK